MSMTDPIADFLTRIRNAQMRNHAVTKVPSSKIKVAIANTLRKEGFVKNYEISKDNSGFDVLEVELHYYNGTPSISELKRVSKPGRRVYSSVKELPRVHGGLGTYILSTPKGILSDHECRKQNVGGEILCKVF